MCANTWCCISASTGNSGGPLLDSKGRLVGINTAIIDPSGAGGFSGVGFAIPIDSAKVGRAVPIVHLVNAARRFKGQFVIPIDFAKVGRAVLIVFLGYALPRGLKGQLVIPIDSAKAGCAVTVVSTGYAAWGGKGLKHAPSFAPLLCVALGLC